MTFKQWMTKVNEIVEDKVGLDTMSLPDVAFYDWYEAEMTPREAVEQLAEELRDEFGDLVDALL